VNNNFTWNIYINLLRHNYSGICCNRYLNAVHVSNLFLRPNQIQLFSFGFFPSTVSNFKLMHLKSYCSRIKGESPLFWEAYFLSQQRYYVTYTQIIFLMRIFRGMMENYTRPPFDRVIQSTVYWKFYYCKPVFAALLLHVWYDDRKLQ